MARLFARGSGPETARIADILRKETFGGALLLIAAAAALIWANSPWSAAYEAVRDAQVGPGVLHLHLSLGTWAADGLLAIFFFVAGLELKREFVAGDLRDPRLAALPVAAALSGVAVPAGLYFAINLGNGGDTSGWAIPDRDGHRVRARRPRSRRLTTAVGAADVLADARRRRVHGQPARRRARLRRGNPAR